MKVARFTDEQIIGFLKQAEAGIPIKDICSTGGFSQPTFYKWRSRFGGMEASDAAKLRDQEAENAKLKRLLAEAHLDIHELPRVSRRLNHLRGLCFLHVGTTLVGILYSQLAQVFEGASNWDSWAAAGFKDTLLRWKVKPESGYGNKTAIQPGVQA